MSFPSHPKRNLGSSLSLWTSMRTSANNNKWDLEVIKYGTIDQIFITRPDGSSSTRESDWSEDELLCSICCTRMKCKIKRDHRCTVLDQMFSVRQCAYRLFTTKMLKTWVLSCTCPSVTVVLLACVFLFLVSLRAVHECFVKKCLAMSFTGCIPIFY